VDRHRHSHLALQALRHRPSHKPHPCLWRSSYGE
jgi:hypothetical protein